MLRVRSTVGTQNLGILNPSTLVSFPAQHASSCWDLGQPDPCLSGK